MPCLHSITLAPMTWTSAVARARRRARIVIVIILAGSAMGRVAAQVAQAPDPREAKPERPSVATHAYTVAPGIVEAEMGIQAQHPTPSSRVVGVPVLLKIGLPRRLQLDISPGWLRNESDGRASAGLTDLAVGVKWHAADAVPVLGSMAVQGTVKLATGSETRATGTGTTDFNVLAISSHVFGGVSLDVNAGYARRSGNGTRVPKDWTVWACSAGIPIAGPLGWSAEIFGYPGTRGPSGTGPIVGMLLGPTWTPQRSIVLDGGLIISLENMGGAAAYAGLTWNIGQVWMPRPGRP